ncbi:MAG: T9SS type A sorting domain-containing protein [Saprospiraceae bacterium]|nr:T9SS type A sorting domain-containing protein [Saprospiraceae bacterium]
MQFNTFLKSNDYGITWDGFPSPLPTGSFTFLELGNQVGLVTKDGILKTDDDFLSTSFIPFPTQQTQAIGGVSHRDGISYACFRNGGFFSLADTDTVWQSHTLPITQIDLGWPISGNIISNCTVVDSSVYFLLCNSFNSAPNSCTLIRYNQQALQEFATLYTGLSWASTLYAMDSILFLSNAYGHGQLLRSTDKGESWEAKAFGMDNFGSTIMKSVNGNVWVANQNIYAQTPAGDWLALPDSAKAEPAWAAFFHADFFFRTSNQQVQRKPVQGGTWETVFVTPEQAYSEFSGEYFLSDENRLFVQTAQHNIYYTDDLGQTWQNLPMQLAPQGYRLRLAKGNLLVAQAHDVQFSEDFGNSWQLSFPSASYFQVMGQKLLAVKDDGAVWTTYDFGATWFNTGNPIFSASSGLFGLYGGPKVVGDLLLLNLYDGIYATKDDGRHWAKISNAPVHSYQTSPPISGTFNFGATYLLNGDALYAAGIGYGVWETSYSELYCTMQPQNSIVFDTVVISGNYIFGFQVFNDTFFQVQNPAPSLGCDTLASMNIHVFHPTNTKEASVQLGLSTYPNPFSTHLTLEANDPNSTIESIEVVDALGRRVAVSSDFRQNQLGKSQIVLPTTNWQPGIYYIFARISAQTSPPIKLVKY